MFDKREEDNWLLDETWRRAMEKLGLYQAEFAAFDVSFLQIDLKKKIFIVVGTHPEDYPQSLS